jgi:hypothetical protein
MVHIECSPKVSALSLAEERSVIVVNGAVAVFGHANYKGKQKEIFDSAVQGEQTVF